MRPQKNYFLLTSTVRAVKFVIQSKKDQRLMKQKHHDYQLTDSGLTLGQVTQDEFLFAQLPLVVEVPQPL